jgi:hypothetical protein
MKCITELIKTSGIYVPEGREFSCWSADEFFSTEVGVSTQLTIGFGIVELNEDLLLLFALGFVLSFELHLFVPADAVKMPVEEALIR